MVNLGAPEVHIDTLSCEPTHPYGIITVDKHSPREFDDGVAVEPLDEDSETYRVRVFAVDTSPHYLDDDIVSSVLHKTESRYLSSGDEGGDYNPMLDAGLVQELHFNQGSVRDALVISFIVGANHRFSDAKIGFGKVEVLRNYDYRRFSKNCKRRGDFKHFVGAARHILDDLNPDAIDTYAPDTPPSGNLEGVGHFSRGARMNGAFMVAGNYAVAKTIEDGQLAIFRIHDPDSGVFDEILDPRVATFSKEPGPHVGLGLDRYTRVTSPLRRAEDFIMLGLLRASDSGRLLEKRDKRIVHDVVRRLNQRVISNVYHGRYHKTNDEGWAES